MKDFQFQYIASEIVKQQANGNLKLSEWLISLATNYACYKCNHKTSNPKCGLTNQFPIEGALITICPKCNAGMANFQKA